MELDWGEQHSGAFERILKVLVLDLNRLHERIHDIEKAHVSSFVKVQDSLVVLRANIQGFDTQAGTLKDHHRQHALDDLSGRVPRRHIMQSIETERLLSSPATSNIYSNPGNELMQKSHVDRSRSLNAVRLRARQRWHWVLLKIRMHMLCEKISMTAVRLGKRKSISARLKQVEGVMEKAHYKIQHICTNAAPEKIEVLTRVTRELKEILVGAPGQCAPNIQGALSRLMATERKCDAIRDMAAAADSCSKNTLGSLKTLQMSLQTVAQDTASAIKVTKDLCRRADEAAFEASLPRACGIATGLVKVLKSACVATMESRRVFLLPGGRDLVEKCITPICQQLWALEESPPITIQDSRLEAWSLWRAKINEASRLLYMKLRDDDDVWKQRRGIATLRDVPVDAATHLPDDQTLRLNPIILEIIAKCKNTYALVLPEEQSFHFVAYFSP